MFQDLRFAVRMLVKQPAFAAVASLTLAIGIGATAAVFSLVQGVLLTSPPYQDPDRLVLIPSVRIDSQQVERIEATPAFTWMDWQQHAQSFESIAAYVWTFNFVVDADGSESFQGMVVTPEYFRALGIQPMVGRAFTELDAQPQAAVVILGYDFWQRRFGGDRAIVGKTIRMSRRDTPPTVVGIMPPGVRFLPSPTASREPSYNVNASVDVWMPAVPNPQRLKQSMWDVVGRLKPGVTPAAAQAELAVLSARQAEDDRGLEGRTPRVQPLVSAMNVDGRRILLPLFGAAALVLFIACGNTAALLLVRGLQRQQEYAVRSALGVSRAALVRQVSIESVVLALIGGVAGVGLAFGIVRLFKAIGGQAIPRLDAVTTGWPLLASGLALAIVAALVAGLVPALRASRLDLNEVLKSSGARGSVGRGERRTLQAVTMIQTALTLALLVGAGLLIRTMHNVANVKSGYSMDRILTMTVTAVQGDLADFHARALERVSRVPGVQQAAFAWGTPLTGNDWPGLLEVEGHPVTKPSDRIAVPLRSVTPGYFALLDLAIEEGRDFRASDDRQAAGVAMVNRTFADRYFVGTTRAWKESLEQRTGSAGDRNHRRRSGCAHQRSDANAGAGSLSLVLAGHSVFERSRRAYGGRSADGHRGHPAGVACRGSHGRGRAREDARGHSYRFAGVADLREAAARRILDRRHTADADRRLRCPRRCRSRRAAARSPSAPPSARIAGTSAIWYLAKASAWLPEASCSASRARSSRRACCGRFCSRLSPPIRQRWRARGCCLSG